jgi:NADPH-dependent ferric siderophore reductase
LSAFGAAESRQITAVRKYLRRELGLRSDQVFMTGYWRRDAP